jgi:UDP-2,4-diacetamido-2,4,6-trideoxy-beta-L-altropyranose hydrolase
MDGLVKEPMQVVFRADASLDIGSGHVMRCLTLADALRKTGAKCHFLTRLLPGNMAKSIAQKGHQVTLLKPPASGFHPMDSYEDWLAVPQLQDIEECAPKISSLCGGRSSSLVVMDHYGLHNTWVSGAVPGDIPVLVIDDLANRVHQCDLLLDQNLGRMQSDYQSLVPAPTPVLTGPEFALLRPTFAQSRGAALARRVDGRARHILIAMGGMDKDNTTSDVLRALSSVELPKDFRATVVLNGSAPNLSSVRTEADKMPFQVEVRTDVADMAALMTDADMSVGGAGSTSWERCCLGLPSFIVTIADNQIPAALALDAAKGATYLGDIRKDQWQKSLSDTMWRILADPDRLRQMARNSSLICDGRGAERVVDAISKVVSQ